ncbi:MAG: hypothetical protein IJT07_02350 [Oscillospiraceae bacterium]|nr:hypothetical protein [Oscillospiraceae bacterium]
MNCMRCGRETAEGEAFCPACLENKKSGAAPESLDRKSVLWVEQKIHATRAAETPREKRPISAKTLRTLLIATLAVLLAVIGGAVVEHLHYRDYETLRHDLAIREADITLREKEADALDAKVAEAERQLAETKAELAKQSSASRKLETMKREVDTLTQDNTALTEEAAFWRSNVVFYSIGNDWYYHYYGCKNLNLSLPFQVYTPETATTIGGLLPCPVCGK